MILENRNIVDFILKMRKITDFLVALWRKPLVIAVCNLTLVMLLFSLCRVFFFLIYRDTFVGMTWPHFVEICLGGLRFDLSAILLFNSLYTLCALLPLHLREDARYRKVVKIVFLSVNILLLVVNCADMAYFPFTNRRTTVTFFSEFQNDGNLLKIIAIGLIDYWYIALFCAALITILVLCYRPYVEKNTEPKAVYYPLHTAVLLACIYFTVIGIRGGFGAYTRPINISNAAQYINRPVENALVLNTPFSLFTTIERKPYESPRYFSSDELSSQFNPIHTPVPTGDFRPLNVVVIIMESFGKEYVGFFNHDLDSGTYVGYTPFLDSLLTESLTFSKSFANGRKSIDAMPSTLSSIPMFIEPYITTPYATNEVSSIAKVLKDEGYYSAFFHGAPNGSMGFQAYANAAGYDDYFGMTEYGNAADFDGVWAIWDEEFLQFFADKMGEFRQPFITTVFSASSHHPFAVPKRYEGVFPEGTHPIHKCIGYSDYALRRFFEKMRRYPWFDNTLFVFTADHTNVSTHAEYQNDRGMFEVPVFFYMHGSDLRGVSDVPMAQTDIMPTILQYLRCAKPYFAFGSNVIDAASPHYVVNYNNGVYQLFGDSLMLQFDGKRTVAVYNYCTDRLLQHNLCDSVDVAAEERYLKAVVQQYVERMINDELTIK